MGADGGPGVTYTAARAVLRPALRVTSRHQWTGQAHIPRDGGCVVVSNHLSHADPLPLADFLDAAGRYPRFLGKAELFDVRIMGRLLRNVGQIPVQRESEHAGVALSAAVDAVRSGECVVVYPEGTLTRDPELWPMVGKTGAARIWWQTRCPVIPVAQWGPHELLAPYGRVPQVWRRPVMKVTAGPALTLSTEEPPHYQELTGEIMASLSALLASVRGVSAPTSVFDPRASDLPRTGNPRKNRPHGQSPSREGTAGPDDEGTA
ncbi:MAG: lysophospholipid acyltransferase family protein [Actinomycetes bacterium]